MLDSKMDFRGSWWALAVAGAGFALVATLFASWTAGKSGIDDVYITYVYARSFAQGHGLTWPGSTALGTSSPFLAVVLGSLSALTGLEVPALGNAFAWIAIAIGSLGLFALGRAERWPWAGLAAGALWLLAAPSHNLLGNEYLPAIAAVIWAFHERARGRLASAGILLALAAMFRAETGLAAPILASLEVRRSDLRGSARRIARVAIAAILVAGAWLVALYAISGTVLPATFAAKRAQSESALGIWSSNAGWSAALAEPDSTFPRDVHTWWWPLSLAAVAAIALRTWKRDRDSPFPSSAIALAVWGATHLALVLALGIPYYPWYAAPLRFAQLILPALALAVELPRGSLPWLRRGWLLAAGVSLAMVAAATRRDLNWLRSSPGDLRRSAYAQAAELAGRYPQGTRIAAWEVGFLGWESSRPVVDLLGLVSDGASLDAVRRGDLRSNAASLRSDLLMMPLASRGLLNATAGEPRRFLVDYRLDRLQISSQPPLAVYRRASLASRGEADVDLLATIAEGNPKAQIEWHRAAGISLLSLALARGEQTQVHLPPGPRRNLTVQLTAPKRRARLQIAIESDEAKGGSIEQLEAAEWKRFITVVPESKIATTITFSCLRGNGCRIGQPYLGAAYVPAPEASPHPHPRGSRPRRPAAGRWKEKWSS